MPTQARIASARQFFSRGGALAEWHTSYEFRGGQVEMADGGGGHADEFFQVRDRLIEAVQAGDPFPINSA